MGPNGLVFKWCLIETFQVACSRFTVATTASLASLAPSALTLLWFLLLFFTNPSAFFIKTTHTNAWSTPSCVNPTKKALDFRFPSNSTEHVWALRRTSRQTELKENTEQGQSVFLSVHPHTSGEGVGSLSRQKQWMWLPSETMTEGLIFKVLPLTVHPFMAESVFVITNTNESH